MSDLFASLMRDRVAQLDEYQAFRATHPAAFGNSPDGAMDGTPETGPLHVFCFSPDQKQAWLLWHVHKWPWPMQYWYCFGRASDSRGERTDETLMLDVRDLPKQYVGRLKLDSKTTWFRNHRKAIGAALADGYDLASHAARMNEEARQEAAARAKTLADRATSGMCKTCGKVPATTHGECQDCFEIPF